MTVNRDYFTYCVSDQKTTLSDGTIANKKHFKQVVMLLYFTAHHVCRLIIHQQF